MFNKILIANRGEIAIRIIRACRDIGIKTVAIYSEIDENSLHTLLADEKYCVGPADSSESYMNSSSIIAAALTTKAEAIHPGYGFLSENADFADAVIDAGLVWIGPSPETIRMVGNKDAARTAMQLAGLPMIEGSELLVTQSDALKAADEIGYPVIFKPIAGGGGQGIFIAHDKQELEQWLTTFDFPANHYFAERCIEDARHIEVQILADNYGHIIHLGERECSLQRRNQKILEEAPSSALNFSMRQEVGLLAVNAAANVHYSNAGTVEFLFDKKSRKFYFMEINPRVQVEHGVTELITGINIVRKQIRIAAGEPLNLKQDNIKFSGHAIECRINAEDSEQNFMPSPGTINFYHEPGGPGVRMDSGVCSGMEISPYYDSLVSKLLVLGRTRGDAIRLMRRALDEYIVSGVKTTIGFHRQILRNPQFCSGNTSTRFIHQLTQKKQ